MAYLESPVPRPPSVSVRLNRNFAMLIWQILRRHTPACNTQRAQHQHVRVLFGTGGSFSYFKLRDANGSRSEAVLAHLQTMLHLSDR